MTMARRFTGNELFKLRNLIPIDNLIEEQLNLPSKISEGYFRFLCPICNEFQTATNPKTNLARCFCCEKNFNPIDLVMIVKGVGFIESVKYLKKLLPEKPDGPMAGQQHLNQMIAGIGKSIGE
jgi:DNA primase